MGQRETCAVPNKKTSLGQWGTIYMKAYHNYNILHVCLKNKL